MPKSIKFNNLDAYLSHEFGLKRFIYNHIVSQVNKLFGFLSKENQPSFALPCGFRDQKGRLALG